MNNKKKWIVRIVAVVLALLMFGGVVIASFVNAAATDSVEKNPLVPYEDTEDFAWSEHDGYPVITLKSNDKTVIRLKNLPYGLDNDVMYAFIAAIETKDVRPLKFEKKYGYAIALSLDDGHYVVYGNDIAWAAKDGTAYSVNNGEPFCFSVGEVQSNGNSYLFNNVNGIVEIELGTFSDGYKVVKYKEDFIPGEEYNSYIFENSFNDIPTKPAEVNQFSRGQSSESSTQATTAEQTTEKPVGGGSIVFGALKRSAGFIIAFIACAVAYIIIKRKKEEQLSERLTTDKYDEHNIE